MSTMKVDGLTKAFGAEALFAGVGFELQRGEKLGLIGANGAGKTTLMRCLLGFEQADSGQVAVMPGYTVGYVEQDTAIGGGTLAEELLSSYSDIIACQDKMRRLEEAIASTGDEAAQAGLMREYAAATEQFERNNGYAYQSMIRRIASGLGFGEDDLSRNLSTFSGGQKTRISLAKALVRQPDFLFLDEPTNHLDIEMTEWLENFLRDYPGGVLIISHDRYFLDKVVGKVLELENGALTVYRGNYSDFLQQKAEKLIGLQNAYDKQQAYIAKAEEYIRRYRAGIKARQARGRQSQLSRLERIDGPAGDRSINLAFDILEGCAERVAELLEVTAVYGEKIVFKNLSLLIRRGESVALIGPNGAGKTTILKLLTGQIQPAGGRVKLGSRVRIGYFAQEHEGLNPKQRVIDEVVTAYGFNEERARNYLGAFLFSGDAVYKLVGDLSGGEKARLALLKLMLSGANFLVLDEPTNHLDIDAREAVEAAIADFPGTFLIVSHDRYLLDKIAHRVFELTGGQLTEYHGNYSYYHYKKNLAPKAITPAKPKKTGKAERPQRRAQDAGRLIKKLEEEIAALENEIAAAEDKLNDPASHDDPVVSQTLAAEYAELQSKLEAKYDQWLAVTGGE